MRTLPNSNGGTSEGENERERARVQKESRVGDLGGGESLRSGSAPEDGLTLSSNLCTSLVVSMTLKHIQTSKKGYYIHTPVYKFTRHP